MMIGRGVLISFLLSYDIMTYPYSSSTGTITSSHTAYFYYYYTLF